jgi:hypothetical protein
MKKCKVCSCKIEVSDSEICKSCEDWYFILYYKYKIYPYILDWHETC